MSVGRVVWTQGVEYVPRSVLDAAERERDEARRELEQLRREVKEREDRAYHEGHRDGYRFRGPGR